MARNLAPDKERASIAILAAVVALGWHSAIASLFIIVAAGVLGWFLFRSTASAAGGPVLVPFSRNLALAAAVAFFALLLGLPVVAQVLNSHAIDLFDRFYRIGSLVFGGGHVALPLLQREVVTPGWVSGDQFLAGYGAAQAVPGPLFTFSAYLGAVSGSAPSGVLGAVIALTAVFLPSFFFVLSGLPAWSILRQKPAFMSALRGVNAGVVGLLLAALYTPVFTSAVGSAADFSIAIAGFGLLAFWKVPPLAVVILSVLGAVGIAGL
jgi:chromate transporter